MKHGDEPQMFIVGILTWIWRKSIHSQDISTNASNGLVKSGVSGPSTSDFDRGNLGGEGDFSKFCEGFSCDRRVSV